MNEEKAIVKKLSTRPEVQLLFLEKLIQSNRSPDFVDDELVELHVRLLCESRDPKVRKRVLPELKKYGRFPGRCLELCQ